jgi:hypothetical protein
MLTLAQIPFGGNPKERFAHLSSSNAKAMSLTIHVNLASLSVLEQLHPDAPSEPQWLLGRIVGRV